MLRELATDAAAASPTRFQDSPYQTVSDGQRLIGLPLASHTQVLFFDRERITLPPLTVEQLTDMNRTGLPIGPFGGADSPVLQAETALQHPMVLAKPRPLAPIVNFGQFSIDYIVLAYVADAKDRALVASELRMTYWNALKAHGIEVPYPQSDIHVRSGALEG